jgi:Tfp pilus assembly protein PilF
MIFAREGMDARAESELRRALTLDPDRGAAIAALADVLVRTGRTDEARALLGKALAGDEGVTEIRLSLGRLEARSGRMEEASRQMSEAVKRDPGSPLARAQYGMLLAAQDDVESAIEQIRQALVLDPSLFDLRLHLASLYLDAGRHRECEDELLKAVAERPADPRPHQFLITVYEATGRPADAARERARLKELGASP